MENLRNAFLENSINSIHVMIGRSEQARKKFSPGTSQYTLLKNRIRALEIAVALLERELSGHGKRIEFKREELKKALSPIDSLISKSEKACTKLLQGTWQHSMLERNLSALSAVRPLLIKEIESA